MRNLWKIFRDLGSREFESYFDRMKIGRYSRRYRQIILRRSSSRFLYGKRRIVWSYIKRKFGRIFMRKLMGVGVEQDNWVTSSSQYRGGFGENEAEQTVIWRFYIVARRCYRETRIVQDSSIDSSTGGA